MILPFKFLVLAALHHYPRSTGMALAKAIRLWTGRKDSRSCIQTVLKRLQEEGYAQGTQAEIERSGRPGTKVLVLWQPTESGTSAYLDLKSILWKVVAE